MDFTIGIFEIPTSSTSKKNMICFFGQDFSMLWVAPTSPHRRPAASPIRRNKKGPVGDSDPSDLQGLGQDLHLVDELPSRNRLRNRSVELNSEKLELFKIIIEVGKDQYFPKMSGFWKLWPCLLFGQQVLPFAIDLEARLLVRLAEIPKVLEIGHSKKPSLHRIQTKFSVIIPAQMGPSFAVKFQV